MNITAATTFATQVTSQPTVWARVTGMITAARRHRRTHHDGYFEIGVMAREQFRL